MEVSISRKFAIHERHTLEVRADAFNIQNRVNFSNPVATLNSGNFGKITSDVTVSGGASGDPGIIQVAMKYSF